MNVVKPKKFRMKIASCGTDTCNATFEKMECESALELMLGGVLVISEQLVRDSSAQLQYDLACALLRQLEGWDEKKLLNDLKKDMKKEFDAWKIK